MKLVPERCKQETGNVVIELVLAVTLFGSLLWPAIQAISAVSSAYRLTENSAAVVARAWTVTEATMRSTVISALRASLVARSRQPLTFHVTCVPSCDSAVAEVRVTASVKTGVPGFSQIESTYVLERDAYGL